MDRFLVAARESKAARWSARLAAVLTGALVASMLTVPSALAAPGDRLPALKDRSAKVSPLKRPAKPWPKMPGAQTRPVVWPKAGSKVVDLPAAVQGARHAATAVVGGLPVRVAPAWGPNGDVLSERGVVGLGASIPSRVRVEVFDRAAAKSVGAALLLRVGRADAKPQHTRVRVEVGYSAFRNAFGADWDRRLRLVVLPGCAVGTPRAAGCAESRTLASDNDGEAGVVSAEVPVPAGAAGAVVGLLAAAASTEVADFSKTDLKASSSWAAGGNSGDFAYSYPVSVPQVPGDLVPAVSLNYSSGAVDGQTAGGNTQPGVFGEGWSYTPGFVQGPGVVSV